MTRTESLGMSQKITNNKEQNENYEKARNSSLNGKDGFATYKNADQKKNKVYTYTIQGDNESLSQAKNALMTKINKNGVKITANQLLMCRSFSDCVSQKEWSGDIPKKGDIIFLSLSYDSIKNRPKNNFDQSIERYNSLASKFKKIENIYTKGKVYETLKGANGSKTVVKQVNGIYIINSYGYTFIRQENYSKFKESFNDYNKRMNYVDFDAIQEIEEGGGCIYSTFDRKKNKTKEGFVTPYDHIDRSNISKIENVTSTLNKILQLFGN